MKSFVRSAALALCAAAGALGCTGLALAQTPTVIVNGRVVTFDQPPVVQAGRVFVPLRGVFERLGASVVYENGLINATGNGRNISLHIGSTQATVNGQTQTVDVPPYVIAGRTLVPLRFVAQALGASVNWQQSDNTVHIVGSGATAAAPPPPPVNRGRNYLRGLLPVSGARVRGSFELSGRTMPNSRVTVTARSPRGAIGGVFGARGGGSQSIVRADRNGYFSVQLRAGGIARGGTLRIMLQSTAPNGSTAAATLTYGT